MSRSFCYAASVTQLLLRSFCYAASVTQLLLRSFCYAASVTAAPTQPEAERASRAGITKQQHLGGLRQS